MIARCQIAISLLMLVGFAQLARADDPQAWTDYLHFGDCQLAYDPITANRLAWPTLCLQAKASTSVLLRTRAPENNAHLSYLEGYAGLHLGAWLALHGSARRQKLILINAADDAVLSDVTATDALFIAIGNPALHRYRIHLGKRDMPFGINYSPSPKINLISLRTKRYWQYPDYVAALTLDNLVDAVAEVAVASDELPYSRRPTLDDGSVEQAIAMRLSYDISALEGTRLMVFAYGKESGQRRYGAGLINRTGSGNQTTFEWIRWRDQPDGRSHSLQQIFRLNYAGAFITDSRPIFEYESEERTYRLVTYGHDFKMSSHLIGHLSASYYYDDRPEREGNFWFFTLGLQMEL